MLLEYCIRCGSCTDQRDRPSGLCPNCLMEDTMKHTPGPWKAGDTARHFDDRTVVAGLRLVANCGGYSDNRAPDLGMEENRANSQRIVECVNAFEPGGIVSQLVEVAKEAQNILNPERGTYINLSAMTQAHQRITDAIAAVEQLLKGDE